MIYIVTQSVDGGRLAGLVSALGIATGGLVHVAAAAVGLSALLLVGDRVRGREVRGRRVPDRAGDPAAPGKDARPIPT